MSGKEEFYWSDPVNFDGNVLINVSQDKIWKFRTDAVFFARCGSGGKELVVIVPNEKCQEGTIIGFGFVADIFHTDMEFIELAPIEGAKVGSRGDNAGSGEDALTEMIFLNSTDGSTQLKWTADKDLSCKSDSKY